MQFWILTGLLVFFWFWMRRPEEGRGEAPVRDRQQDDKMDALARRVATLEAILLDRDRQLRDRFGDL